MKPTIYTGTKNGMRIAREEIFGPVAVLIPFKDENDAVLQGNDTTYGLAAGVCRGYQPRSQGCTCAKGGIGLGELLRTDRPYFTVWWIKTVGAWPGAWSTFESTSARRSSRHT